MLRARVDALIREKRFQSALDQAKLLSKIEPTDENRRRLIDCYLGRGLQLYEQGSARDAVVALDGGLNQLRGEPDLLAKFAEAFARIGEIHRATELLTKIPEGQPTRQIFASAADSALQRGTAGRDALPDTMKADFDRIRTAFEHAEAGRDDAAREALQAIGLTSPFLEWKLLLRGLLAYYQNDDQRAIDNWSRLDPARLPARLTAPLRTSIDRDFAAAQPPATQQVLHKQLQRLQDGVILNGLRAIQAALVNARGNLSAVFRQIELILPQLRQQHPDLVNRLADVMYWEVINQGQPTDITRYQRFFGHPPDDPNFDRMRALAMEGESGLASAHPEWLRYEKALAGMSQFSEAERARARAMVWLRMGENAERHAEVVDATNRLPPSPFHPIERLKPLKPGPEECYRKAQELAPDWIEPHSALVNWYFYEGQDKKTVAAAEALLQRFPDHLPTLDLLARVHMRLVNYAGAAHALERALQVNPLNRMFCRLLGQTRRKLATNLAMQGRIDEAHAELDAAVQLLQGEPMAIVCATWAAVEFLAGNNAKAEELLECAAQTPEGRAILDGWMYAHAVMLKLPKDIKARFEKPFKEQLETTQPTPEKAIELLLMFNILNGDRLLYHGAKTHQKKAIAQVEKTVNLPYTEQQMERGGNALLSLGATKVLRKMTLKWKRDFPTNAWPLIFEMESYLTGAEERWPLWRLKPLAEQAKTLAEKMPASQEREALLERIDARLRQFQDLNPFAALFDRFADSFDFGSEDDPW